MFSKLDIIKAFHQLELHKDSRYLTTIITHLGLYRYLRLHMGVSCASEVFTEEIRRMFEGIPGQANMTDDILVYGDSWEAHDKSLMMVLERLENRGVTLRADKCEFYKEELTFFGLRSTKNGVSPTEDRCRALKEAAVPVNAKELRSFLCTVLWSARFIKDICSISEPLWSLLRKQVKWRWTEVEQASFEKIKNSISTRCMAYFNVKWSTEVIVDAGPSGIGAVLCQYNPENNDDRRIVCFASRMLTDVERRYSQCENEALAAVWGPSVFGYT